MSANALPRLGALRPQPDDIALTGSQRFETKAIEMSPTYFAVQMARLDEELAAARLAGNFPRMQRLLGSRPN
jgi:hypothetical protein